MKKTPKNILRLILSAGIATGLIVMLSVPLISPLSALGGIFNPIGGVWSIDHTTPKTMTVKMPFMRGSVTVVKDMYGVPHIYAEHESDACAVMGYLQAHDRLFQLEIERREISGLLSEIFGPGSNNTYLNADKYFRNLRLESAGQNLSRYIEATDPTIYGGLSNFTAGINYVITTTNDLPFEFHLLGFTPGLWGPGDVLAVEKLMDEQLAFTTNDIERTLLNESLVSLGNATAMNTLYPRVNPFEKPITVDYGHYPSEHLISPFEADPLASNLNAIVNWVQVAQENSPIPNFEGYGSDNWVVNSSKSATGAPILCNDMHLGWSLPMLWYQAQIVAADTGLNVQGFTFPGVPFIVAGHNENVAWGFTNAGCDHIDWYQFNDKNGQEYLYNGTWYPYNNVTEQIPVKGQASVKYTIRSTIQGPVMDPGNLPYTTGTVLSFRWVAIAVNTTTFEAVYGMNHASNMATFNAALVKWTMPSQNIIYADRWGNISIRVTGYVPIRNGVTNSSDACRFILNGSSGEHGWTGQPIPFVDLPHSVNPAQGYLASANQLSAGPNYAYYFQDTMDTGYRGARINDLLFKNPSVSIKDVIAIQNDVYDKSAEWFVPQILAVFNNNAEFPSSQKTTLINQAIAVLQAWNDSSNRYKMYANMSAPTIFQAIIDCYMNDTFDEFSSIANKPYFQYPDITVLENLTLNAPNSVWFYTKGVHTTAQDVIVQAIKNAVGLLAASSPYKGSSPADWLYGDVHQVIWNHLLYLAPLSAGPYPGNGSGVTTDPSYAPLFGTANWGASERVIIDFSQTNNEFASSRYVIPGGSSGDPVSPHYTDQLQLFLKGEYIPLYYHAIAAAFAASESEAVWTFT